MDFAELASYVGFSASALRALLCLLSSLPISFFHHFIPTSTGRHAYAFLSGSLLCWLAYGNPAIYFFLTPLLVGYTSLLLHRRLCGYVTFATLFAYLAYCHVMLMSGSKWRDGEMDCTGTLMILILKVVSVAMDYQDGLIPDDKAASAMYRNRVSIIPSPLEYLGFIFNCGTILVGPLYSFKSYQAYVENALEWAKTKSAKPLPSPWGLVSVKLVRGLFCLAIYQILGPYFPVSFFSDPRYSQLPLLARVGYLCAVATTFRFSYYFVWSIAESALVLSGLGFTGWDPNNPSKPLWGRAVNCDILKLEFSWSSNLLPAYWNMTVGSWLRTYVYDRLQAASLSSSVWNLIATQVISALWHGLYPGYYLFFVNTALGQSASRVIYKFQRTIPERHVWLTRVGYVIHGLFTMFNLNYSEMGFLMLSIDKTVVIWRSLYFAGTIFPIAIAFGLAPFVPSAKKLDKKAR